MTLTGLLYGVEFTRLPLLFLVKNSELSFYAPKD